MKTATVLFPADDISVLGLGDEMTVFNAATGRALVLNRTAADVLALADGRTTLGGVVEVLARAYGVEADVITGGVQATAAKLAEEGVLEFDGP